MKVADALPYVSHVLDTALSPDHTTKDIGPGTVLVGWQCGFEPLFVAVVASYTAPDLDEAVDIAVDYLLEKRWFTDSTKVEPDFVITV